MAILALVAVPGTVGHHTTTPTVPAEAFQAVLLDDAPGMVTSSFDPAIRSASILEASTTLTEPAPDAVLRERPDVPAVSGSGGSIVVPHPWRRSGSSWYGPGFYGSGTACGQTYTRTIIGVAHRTLPCGTRVVFRNPVNGRVVEARVIDRGPYVSGRDWDLSRGLCEALDHCYTAPIQWRLP